MEKGSSQYNVWLVFIVFLCAVFSVWFLPNGDLNSISIIIIIILSTVTTSQKS